MRSEYIKLLHLSCWTDYVFMIIVNYLPTLSRTPGRKSLRAFFSPVYDLNLWGQFSQNVHGWSGWSYHLLAAKIKNIKRKESITYSFHWHRSYQMSKYGWVVCVCPLVPGCMLVTVSAIRLTISPPTCVPIAAAGDSGHTFHQPTLSCSPSVARQTLVTGNQVRSHCRLQVTISIRTQPSHQLTSSSEERVEEGHDGMMAWWQGFPWHPVECRRVSHARCPCKQIYCLMTLGMN